MSGGNLELSGCGQTDYPLTAGGCAIVKVSRNGTELEPTVGRGQRLFDEWDMSHSHSESHFYAWTGVESTCESEWCRCVNFFFLIAALLYLTFPHVFCKHVYKVEVFFKNMKVCSFTVIKNIAMEK